MKNLGKTCLQFPLLLLAGPGISVGVVDLGEAVKLYQHGLFRQAAELLARQTQAAPQDPDLRHWLGKCHLKAHKLDEAVQELEKAVQIRPSNSVYHLWLGRAYGEKAVRAFFLRAIGWAKKVRREFETAVEMSPDSMDARFDLLEFYLEAPALVGGGKDRAETQVREIARRNSRLGYTARARLYESDNKWDLARRELSEATRNYSNVPETYLDLADYLLKRGEFQGVESAAREALRMNSASPRARFLMAAAQVQLKKALSDAEKSLREIAGGPLRDEDPPFAEVHYWLGKAYLQLGKLTEARKEFESALIFDPGHTGAREALSRVRKAA